MKSATRVTRRRQCLSLVRRQAPSVHGLLGAAFCLGGPLHEHLRRLYAASKGAVAYLDESFELEGDSTFYILGCAVVKPGWRSDTRAALSDFYSGEAIHAAPMFNANQTLSLRGAISLAADQHDGADVVVCAPLEKDDPRGDKARVRCVNHLVPMLHEADEVDLFIFDKPSNPGIEKRDKHAFSDLRRASKLDREVELGHFQPSQELLLGLPDMIAWSYRQVRTRRDESWFEPLQAKTAIHEII